MKRIQWILDKDVLLYFGPHDQVTLAQGSHVTPMDIRWVPKHIKDQYKHDYDPKTHVYCYTKFGIVPVPKDKVRSAE